jgi:hypothetical protein
MTKRTTKTTDTTMSLRRGCYDILVLSLNRKSKFYNEDCDALWAGLMKKDATQLRETLSRQRAIARVTDKEIALHCQFDGMM